MPPPAGRGTRVHIAVAALVRHDGLLMAHRAPWREHYADRWALVGGHVEPGESAEQAVVRECQEELGVRPRDPRAFALSCAAPAVVMHGFVVERWDGDPVNAAPEEHDALAWVTASRLRQIELAHPEMRPDLVGLLADA